LFDYLNILNYLFDDLNLLLYIDLSFLNEKQ
jgi:hypothetical protein